MPRLPVSPVPLLVWTVLIAAATQAPATRSDVWEWVLHLLQGDTAGENDAMVAFFYAMGIWPWIVASLLAEELLPAAEPRSWRDRVPAWPFLLASNVGGMFVLGLYFVLRAPDRRPAAPRRWLGWIGHPAFAGLLVLAALRYCVMAVQGDVVALWGTIHVEGFAFTMAWDFLAFAAVSAWWLTRTLGPAHAGWLPFFGTAVGAVQVARRRG